MSTKSHPGDGSHGKGDKGVAAQRPGQGFLRGTLGGLLGLRRSSRGIGR